MCFYTHTHISDRRARSLRPPRCHTHARTFAHKCYAGTSSGVFRQMRTIWSRDRLCVWAAHSRVCTRNKTFIIYARFRAAQRPHLVKGAAAARLALCTVDCRCEFTQFFLAPTARTTSASAGQIYARSLRVCVCSLRTATCASCPSTVYINPAARVHGRSSLGCRRACVSV